MLVFWALRALGGRYQPVISEHASRNGEGRHKLKGQYRFSGQNTLYFVYVVLDIYLVTIWECFIVHKIFSDKFTGGCIHYR